MTHYQIESKAGIVYGIYEGDTPEQAFAAMVAEAGGPAEDSDGAPVEGTPADWIIRKVDCHELTALLRVDGSDINVPRSLTPEQCAALLDAGLIVEADTDDDRPDRRYAATDYARDLIWGRI